MAGDPDADGHADVVVGAHGRLGGELSGYGAAYVVYGPLTGTFEMADLLDPEAEMATAGGRSWAFRAGSGLASPSQAGTWMGTVEVIRPECVPLG